MPVTFTFYAENFADFSILVILFLERRERSSRGGADGPHDGSAAAGGRGRGPAAVQPGGPDAASAGLSALSEPGRHLSQGQDQVADDDYDGDAGNERRRCVLM